MSQTEENIESTLIEDHSLWDRFKNFFVNDYSKLIDDREDQNEKVVRIAVIGKTRVGKGKFINAIRATKKPKKDESDPDEFEIQGPPANVTHGIIPGPLTIEKYGYPDNENPIIYFYDTGGYGDAFNENYNLEEKLKKYQKDNKIKFDAIIFLFASNTFVKEEIQPLKDQEKKVCLILYIANKVDILKSETETEEEFQEEKGKIKGYYLDALKKNKVNKHDLSKNNIYLISSKVSKSEDYFEDEDVSPDGKRLKTELIELLLNIKVGEPLDLFNPFTKQLISYKAKFMQDKVSKNASVSAIKTSWTAIIPFADIFMQNKIVSDYKVVFLKEFGIKPIMDLIEKDEDLKIKKKKKKKEDMENSDYHIIARGSEKWERIKTLVDEINANKILEAINLIFKNDKTELTKEKIGTFFTQIGVLGGGFLSKFWDDIAVCFGRVGGAVVKTGAGIIAIVALPIAIGIYIKFCHSAIMKVIDELTDYSIKIHDVLHE